MKRVGQRIAVANLRFMSVKWHHFIAALLLFIITGWAAPQPPSKAYPVSRKAPSGEDLSIILRQIKIELADLKHETRNHESEMRVFENKLQNQEESFEYLRQQLSDDIQAQCDCLRASNVNLEGKTETLDQLLKNLETSFRGLTEDLRQIKTQANESVTVFGQYKQKITELENIVQTQNQHMQNLEAALQSIVEILQAKQATSESISKASEPPKTYKVQSGDSLEKIARNQKVSVQALREANQLSTDRIVIGQILKIP